MSPHAVGCGDSCGERGTGEDGYLTIPFDDTEKARTFYGALFGWVSEDGLAGDRYAHFSNTDLPMGMTPDDVAVDDEFWATIDQRTDLDDGRLVMATPMTSDWNNWEMHPDGDEVILITDGVVRVAPRQVAGLLRAADIGLVTPARDGMNLVALGYAVLNGDRPCELILSRGAGAADHIGRWCRLVDGTDANGIADAIADSLAVSDESGAADRSQRRDAAATTLTVGRWSRTSSNGCPRRCTSTCYGFAAHVIAPANGAAAARVYLRAGGGRKPVVHRIEGDHHGSDPQGHR